MKEAPDLEKAYLAYRDKGVGFIGAFTTNSDNAIKQFAETYGITFPVGKENGIAEKLGARGVPYTVFIDKQGHIVKKHIGPISYSELAAGVNEILK